MRETFYNPYEGTHERTAWINDKLQPGSRKKKGF